MLIECRDSETTNNVATHKETSSLCLRAGPKTLVILNEHLDRFRERVHVLGLGLVPIPKSYDVGRTVEQRRLKKLDSKPSKTAANGDLHDS